MGTLALGYSERLVMRFGARPTVLAGLALIASGLVLFTRAPVGGGYVAHVLPVMLLLGAGAGSSFPGIMTLAMSGATPADAGLASGLVNTTMQVGGALGLAVLATLASTRSEGMRAAGDPQAVALNGGYHLAYLVGAGLILAAFVIALTVLRSAPRPVATAEPSGLEPRRRPEPVVCTEVA
jgi:MFS family permease